MKAIFPGLLACIATSIVPAGLSHASTLVGTTSDALAINGLVVDGVTYDVTFYNSSYDSVYSSTLPTFLGNSGGAADAASALASALTAFDVTALVGLTQYNAVAIPYSDSSGQNTSSVVVESSIKLGTWATNISTANDPITYSCCDYAGFTVAPPIGATPLPAGLPLFATGLGVLGLLGWRRRRRAQAVARSNQQ
jgi:hypothetical protein